MTLQRFAEELNIPVHLEAYNAHGGSPVHVLNRSVQESAMKMKQHGPYDGGRFILLDQDRIDRDGCEQKLLSMARKKKVSLVRQQCRLECLLGRLISGKFNLGPNRAEAELLKLWPGYTRGFDAISLKERLTIEGLKRSEQLSEEWRELLLAIGFLG